MGSSKYRIAIIGAGNIACKHIEVIKSIPEKPKIGITSRTLCKAKSIAELYNISDIYDNVKDLITDFKPDALMVLVSADQIFSVTKEVIEYGLPIFVEKPPGLSHDETKILAEKARDYNVPNMVGYNRRFYSVFNKGLDIIKQHGKLLGVSVEGHERFWKIADNVNQRLRTQWIYANSTHTIDLLRLFGGELKSISTVNNSYLEEQGDQFAAVMKFESGVLGNYLAHWYSPGGWSVRLFGEGVTVVFNPLEKGVWIDTDFKEHFLEPDEVDTVYKPGFYRQMEAFLSLVKTGVLDWPGQDLSNSFQSMKLAQKISEN